MNVHGSRILSVLVPAAVLAMLGSIFVLGCGTTEEGYEEWERPTLGVSPARGDYRVDSLVNENRRLRQQLDAMAIENRKITARNAELEMRVKEGVAPTVEPAAPTARAERTPGAAQKMEVPSPVVKPSISTPRPTGDLTSRYSDAMQTYRNRDFTGAINQFESLLNAGISGDLVDNCHYWIGQSYYDMKNYREALPQFETILRMAGSDKKPDAQIMIANCHVEMGNTAAAKEAYQKFLTTYPKSPYAKKAQERLMRLR